ncbi:ralBP1-associated Eps domain-containing protein 2 isoform X1 [Stigmatopora argus]
MEQEAPGGGGAAAAYLEGLIPLHEHERRYYSGLHGLCQAAQADSSGSQLSSSKVAELFKASGLPAEMLHQVMEVCGAKRAGYFGTAQFYVALKLLAAAQAGLPIRLECASADLPLPRFTGIQAEPETQSDKFRDLDTGSEKKEAPPPGKSPPCSPTTYHTYPYDSPRKRQMADSHAGIELASSTTECDVDDPWRITQEQLEYYTNQFKSLQPDLGALVLGAVAKNFFTKSKLPIPELSHIWELSDVDQDGALTFSEFCWAFHLIVARKNGYPLPESLPPGLRPALGSLDEKVQCMKNPTIPANPKKDPGDEPCKNQECSFGPVETLKEGATLQLDKFSSRPEATSLDPDRRPKTKTRQRSYSSTSADDAMRKADEPPVPPPRPQKSHSRASSLDLNKLFQQGAPAAASGWSATPPALPPRPPASQAKVRQLNFADFGRFREEDESGENPQERGRRPTLQSSVTDSREDPPKKQAPPHKPARRKHRTDDRNVEHSEPPAGHFVKHAQKHERAVQTAIRKNKEAHAVLSRLNSELQQQLKAVNRERVALETQLELLRPSADVQATDLQIPNKLTLASN